MKVHLIRKKAIDDFTRQNAQGRNVFEEWCIKLKYADWETPADIKRTFPSTDLLGNGSNRAVFDIGGNKFRLIAKYAFGAKQVHLFICWIGIHAEYSRLCNADKQYEVSDY
ncbi:MAG: type II toxin-antitoxin system HigB family toxin [Chitinophagaceae bacterium]